MGPRRIAADSHRTKAPPRGWAPPQSSIKHRPMGIRSRWFAGCNGAHVNVLGLLLIALGLSVFCGGGWGGAPKRKPPVLVDGPVLVEGKPVVTTLAWVNEGQRAVRLFLSSWAVSCDFVSLSTVGASFST